MMFGWIIIIAFLVYIVLKNEGYTGFEQPAITRLKERLAKGDITIEEYVNMKRILEEKQ